VQKRTKVYQDKLAIAKQEIEQLKLTNKTQLDRINELEELQKKKLLEYTQYNEMKIAETKLQRELVTTRSKEVSAISDIIKVAAGVVMTIGGALIYAYTNSSKDNKKSSIKDIISGVTCKATQSIFNISNVIKAGINILFRPLSIIGGLFSLLF
jgi:glucose uptake protein GlcU